MQQTINSKLNSLEKRIENLKALIRGSSPHHNLYAMLGNQVVFGCKITEGYSASDFVLAMEEGTSYVNPDKQIPPQQVYHYPHIANVYGRSFLSTNVNDSTRDDENLVVSDPPGTSGYGRYDIVYIYVNNINKGVGILQGTASEACKNDYDANGLEIEEYPQTYDSAGLPTGAIVVARVYVQYGDTGISNSRIVDLRGFISRFIDDRLLDGRRVFIQSSEPSDAESDVGDLWLDIT